MKLTCIRAHGDHVPGDPVEIPDGAEYSGLYFAKPDDPAAVRAVADAKAAARTAVAPPSTPPKTPAPPLTPPATPPPPGGGKEGA